MKKILVLLTACILLMSLCCAPLALAETATDALAATADTADEASAAPTVEILPADQAAVSADGETEAPAEEDEEEAYTGIATTSSLITIGVLVVLMVGALILSAKRVKWNAAMIAKAAICIALAYLLGMIKVYRMPMGGSITLASLLPLVLFAVTFGPLEGVLIGSVYGLMQLLIDPYVIHPLQLLVDYPMAFGAVALACLVKLIPVNDRLKLPLAMLLGYLGRYIMAVLSGVVFFAEYAGDQGALIYSLVYNITYLGPEALLCCVIAFIPGMNRLPELLRKNAYRDGAKK